MRPPASYTVQPRWKEELVVTGPDGQLVVEVTMGTLHVYFPSEATWARSAPDWAKGRRDEILAAVSAWCTSQNVPLTIEDRAWVSGA